MYIVFANMYILDCRNWSILQTIIVFLGNFMSGNSSKVHMSIHHQIESTVCCPLLFLISTCLTFRCRHAAVVSCFALRSPLFIFFCVSLINLKVASPSERIYILLSFVVFNKHLFNFLLSTCCGRIMLRSA